MHRAHNIEEAPFVPYHSEDEEPELCWQCHGYLVGPPGTRLCRCPQPEPDGGPVRDGNGTAANGSERGAPSEWYAEEATGNGHVEPGVILSSIEPEEVEWLWEPRIPLGKITVIDGDPGNGKSALTTDLGARLTVGRPFPDGKGCEPAGVVIMNAEDGLADTIRPRVDAAGGDSSRIVSLATVEDGEDGEERHVSIPEDIAIIEAAIKRVSAKLVIIDPLMAFLSGGSNAHKDQDIRRALAPLARTAERTGVAVVLVRHLNKASGGNPLYRGGGSIGIIGAARSGLLVGVHPEDETLRVLAGQKSNLSPMPESLAYRIATGANGAARIEYAGASTANADALLRTPTRSRRARRSDRGGRVLARRAERRAGDGEGNQRTRPPLRYLGRHASAGEGHATGREPSRRRRGLVLAPTRQSR